MDSCLGGAILFTDILRGDSGDHDKEKKYTILVVDDDPNIRELIIETLGEDRYQPIVARDGKEALSICEREKPDIIILDVMMPDLDGLEVCLRLRGEILPSHIPFILLTAKGMLEDKIKGMET